MAYCKHEVNSKVLAQFYAILSVVQFTTTHRVVGYVICNCKHVANLKKLCYSFGILHCGPTDFNSMDHYVLRTTQMVIDVCTKVLALFYAILSVVHLQLIEWLAIVNMVRTVKHDSLLSYDVVKLTSTQTVIGNCEYVANCPTDFNSKGHLLLQTCSKFLRICTIL